MKRIIILVLVILSIISISNAYPDITPLCRNNLASSEVHHAYMDYDITYSPTSDYDVTYDQIFFNMYGGYIGMIWYNVNHNGTIYKLFLYNHGGLSNSTGDQIWTEDTIYNNIGCPIFNLHIEFINVTVNPYQTFYDVYNFTYWENTTAIVTPTITPTYSPPPTPTYTYTPIPTETPDANSTNYSIPIPENSNNNSINSSWVEGYKNEINNTISGWNNTIRNGTNTITNPIKNATILINNVTVYFNASQYTVYFSFLAVFAGALFNNLPVELIGFITLYLAMIFVLLVLGR